MRCKACHALLAGVLSLAALTGAADASTPRLTVKPSHGVRSTRFGLEFSVPNGSGVNGSLRNEYRVSASNSTHVRGCVRSGTWGVPPAKPHARVRVTLNPTALGGKWCLGMFHGTVVDILTPVCRPGTECPLFIALLHVGHFVFQVGRHDTTPPQFAGLVSATACTPGAQRPGETTPYHLSWKRATDNVTPSDQIVYEVFESAISGAENFAKPNWTTSPGVTSFTTPGLASHGNFYFVVRARDRAGNVDRNTVQRHGVDPCL
jgi:hypothetical protein